MSTTSKECYESLETCEPLRTIDGRPKHSKVTIFGRNKHLSFQTSLFDILGSCCK